MFYLNQSYIFGISFVSTASFLMYVYFNIYYNLLKQVEQEETPSETELYLQNAKNKFIKCYEKDEFNQNIQAEFYDKEQYNETIIKKDNLLESSWKARILFENTPQGLVIMFYNAYKQGFSYYCDTTISYPFLNAVAMKYASKFYCRDFFIDDSIIPKDHSSPFLHIHEIEVDESKTKTKINVKKGPFAKLKKYDKPKPKMIQTKPQNEPKVMTHIKNKFVYLGKIYKFSPLQKIHVEVPNIQTKDPIPMKYSDYKQWHNPEKFELIAT